MMVATADAIVAELTPAEARALTDHIKLTADQLWRLLLQAHERRAWFALGYQSWSNYIQVEFDMTRSYSYRLLDQGRVIRAIEQASGVSPTGDIVSERVARDLKPQLTMVTSDIAERIEAGEDPAAAVADVISKARTTCYLTSRKREDRHNRHVEAIATTVTGMLDAIDDIDVERIDPDRRPEWADSLRSAARLLNQLAARLEGGSR